ncbi:MAG: pectate lyase [Alistipes sp.]|nr:pectate lyase [Alistipes sp.]
MKRILSSLALLVGLTACSNQPATPVETPSIARFSDCIHHWYLVHEHDNTPRLADDDFRAIADNLIAYQNEDGGWPKNIDWLLVLDTDSVKRSMSAYEGRSTFDNRNIHPQIDYLARVYQITGEERYRASVARAIEYTLNTQYPNGSWIGWEDEAIAFNDGIIDGILRNWKDVLDGASHYDWIDAQTRERIRQSWDAGLQLILDTQYRRHGERTVWSQQCDQQTLQPVGARTYELPALTANESADIVLFLMSIEKPSAEIIEAVEAAVAWFEKTKIEGKRIETISMPEGNPEDRAIKYDRRMVDDPAAEPLWARFYELEDDTIFLCNRDGIKVYSLDKVWPERRIGYSWYGTWGNEVLQAYPAWKASLSQ